jgi:hypothetical protein
MEKNDKEPKTPIADGDARPDIPVDNEEIKDKKKRDKQNADKKFESERNSDINSMEDYKDAK